MYGNTSVPEVVHDLRRCEIVREINITQEGDSNHDTLYEAEIEMADVMAHDVIFYLNNYHATTKLLSKIRDTLTSGGLDFSDAYKEIEEAFEKYERECEEAREHD